MRTNKKILTLDDLVSFFLSNKIKKFDSSEFGYRLCVQVPSLFEISKSNISFDDDGQSTENSDDTMFVGRIKAFHIGKNRNGSYIPKEAALKAMETMAYKPVLAYIENFGDEDNKDYDFTTHEFDVDEDGKINYLESQVGCFTADKPYFEYDEKVDKTFVIGNVAIPRVYTKAADIIEDKGGTKVSVELMIDSMSWNKTENALSLDEFVVQGVTLLGRSLGKHGDTYGTLVEEGMEGAAIDLEDFKKDNNSMINYSKDDKIIELLDKLNLVLSNLSTSEKNICFQKEGDNPMIVEDLQTMDNATLSDNVTENTLPINMDENAVGNIVLTEGDDETNAVNFTENTDEDQKDADDVEDTNDVDDAEDADSTDDADDEKNDKDDVEDFSEQQSSVENTDVKEAEKESDINHFELSYRETINAIDKIINAIDEKWYWICEVYDTYAIISDCESGEHYRITYTKTDDTVTVDDEWVHVVTEYITDAEKEALDLMRKTYPVIESELKQYKLKEEREIKTNSVVNNECYEVIKNTPEFNELCSNMDNYSVDELTTKADLLLAKFVKTTKNFALNNNDIKKTQHVVVFNSGKNEDKANKPYGGIFENYKK